MLFHLRFFSIIINYFWLFYAIFGYCKLFHSRFIVIIINYIILGYFRLCEVIVGYFLLLKAISPYVIIGYYRLYYHKLFVDILLVPFGANSIGGY
jgi:hypothetical protein